MVDRQPAVALLFDEAELGAQLRGALEEHGARIVHEGSLAAFDASMQTRLNPDVLVVNLDDSDDAGIDRLYELVDGERPRLVFNDAQASRGLNGSDRARWARHLAVKVLASGDVDPPRPSVTQTIDVAAPSAPVAEPDAPVAANPIEAVAGDNPEAVPAADMSDLEAELNALLSGAELMPLDDEASAPVAAAVAPPPIETGEIERLLAEGVPAEAEKPEAPQAPAAPEWSLFDDASLADAMAAKPTVDAGVPDAQAAELAEPPTLPTSSLSLVDVETVQVQPERQVSEMLLDDLGSAPARVVMLGAAADGLDSVCGFLAALPEKLSVSLLLAQHFGALDETAVLQRLAASTRLPVRPAATDTRIGVGEVWLVPARSQIQVRRDGRLELQADTSSSEPSIDDSFTMAAGVFGHEALAIVFASESTDAVAGAQAIHDRGGEVWVESSANAIHEGIAAALFAEHLVSRSGTRQELAAHLIEVYP